jgi:hypothetical protein
MQFSKVTKSEAKVELCDFRVYALKSWWKILGFSDKSHYLEELWLSGETNPLVLFGLLAFLK